MKKISLMYNEKDLSKFVSEVKRIPFLKDYPIDEDNVNMFFNINKDHENCKRCKGLSECANDVSGYRRIAYLSEGSYLMKMEACEYKENEMKRQLSNSLIRTLHMPKSILESKLELFDMYSEERKKSLEYAYKFINSFSRTNYMKGLYLYGSYGCGKTFLLGAIANELAKKNITTILMYFPDLIRELKSALNTPRFEQLINELKSVDVLMIDDLGGEMLTSWLRDEVLGPILNYRVSEQLPIFISSNLDPDMLSAHFEQTKDETYNNTTDVIKALRIMSRIQDLTITASLGNKKYK